MYDIMLSMTLCHTIKYDIMKLDDRCEKGLFIGDGESPALYIYIYA